MENPQEKIADLEEKLEEAHRFIAQQTSFIEAITSALSSKKRDVKVRVCEGCFKAFSKDLLKQSCVSGIFRKPLVSTETKGKWCFDYVCESCFTKKDSGKRCEKCKGPICEVCYFDFDNKCEGCVL